MTLLCWLSWVVFQSKLRKPVSSIPPWPLLHWVAAYRPTLLGFLPWLPSVMNCVIGKRKPHNPFLCMLFLVMLFFRATRNKLIHSWISFLKIYLFLFMCLLAWIFVYRMLQRFKEGSRSFGSRVIGCCEPPRGCWLFTAESHLSKWCIMSGFYLLSLIIISHANSEELDSYHLSPLSYLVPMYV